MSCSPRTSDPRVIVRPSSALGRCVLREAAIGAKGGWRRSTEQFDAVAQVDPVAVQRSAQSGAELTVRTVRLLYTRGYGANVTPAALPDAIRIGLDSRLPAIRIGAVTALGEWLDDERPLQPGCAQKLAHSSVAGWSADPKPFVWTKTAEEILDSFAGYCQGVSGAAP